MRTISCIKRRCPCRKLFRQCTVLSFKMFLEPSFIDQPIIPDMFLFLPSMDECWINEMYTCVCMCKYISLQVNLCAGYYTSLWKTLKNCTEIPMYRVLNKRCKDHLTIPDTTLMKYEKEYITGYQVMQ